MTFLSPPPLPKTSVLYKLYNRPYWYSQNWTETSLQLRLMWESFQMQIAFISLMIFPHMSLDCKLVPVQNREYEYVPLSNRWRSIKGTLIRQDQALVVSLQRTRLVPYGLSFSVMVISNQLKENRSDTTTRSVCIFISIGGISRIVHLFTQVILGIKIDWNGGNRTLDIRLKIGV